MSSIVRDPDYRYYNCNIQAPKLYGSEIHADKISFDEYTESGVMLETGISPLNTTHTIAIKCLTKSNCCGELTLYLKNEITNIAQVIMLTLSKTGGTFTSGNINEYQRWGNYSTTSGQNYTYSTPTTSSVGIALTGGPAEIKWVWRGA